MTLRNLPLPTKVLFTRILLTLGTGYAFAVWYLFIVSIQPHMQDDHSVVQAVVEKYYGKRDVTALESALTGGGMGEELEPAELTQLLSWVRGGATEEAYAAVAPIVTNNCAVCHNAEDMPESLLTSFEEGSRYTDVDTGTSAKTLVRVSHIHVFGMTFIFAIISGIFVQSEARNGWRAVIVAIPFLGIWFDIGSWWFTRVNPMFAYTVVVGGAIVGMSIGVQIFLSLYEMWVLPPVTPAGSYPGYAQPPQAGGVPVAYAPPVPSGAPTMPPPPVAAPISAPAPDTTEDAERRGTDDFAI